MTPNFVRSINEAYIDLLETVYKRGLRSRVRDRNVRELFNVVYEYHAWQPIIAIPERKLNYKFMAAEALWIWEGRDDVATVAAYNPQIAQYAPIGSDRFFGAYGPKFYSQADYVVSALVKDAQTRQAVMSFWTESPPADVDLACNDLLTFYIRDRLMFLSVTARSKDVWLGLPYDVFAFALLLHVICAAYNQKATGKMPVSIGTVTFCDVNCHMYEDDLLKIERLLDTADSTRSSPLIEPGPAERGDASPYVTMLKNVMERGFAGFVS